MNKNNFSCQIASDTNYEKLLIQIYVEGEMIAIISQEEGIENAILEIWPKIDGTNWEINFKGFIKAIETAYTRLKER